MHYEINKDAPGNNYLIYKHQLVYTLGLVHGTRKIFFLYSLMSSSNLFGVSKILSMYVEPKKMVWMILFTKQRQRRRCREQSMDTNGEKGGWHELGDRVDIYTLLIVGIK